MTRAPRGDVVVGGSHAEGAVGGVAGLGQLGRDRAEHRDRSREASVGPARRPGQDPDDATVAIDECAAASAVRHRSARGDQTGLRDAGAVVGPAAHRRDHARGDPRPTVVAAAEGEHPCAHAHAAVLRERRRLEAGLVGAEEHEASGIVAAEDRGGVLITVGAHDPDGRRTGQCRDGGQDLAVAHADPRAGKVAGRRHRYERGHAPIGRCGDPGGGIRLRGPDGREHPLGGIRAPRAARRRSARAPSSGRRRVRRPGSGPPPGHAVASRVEVRAPRGHGRTSRWGGSRADRAGAAAGRSRLRPRVPRAA